MKVRRYFFSFIFLFLVSANVFAEALAEKIPFNQLALAQGLNENLPANRQYHVLTHFHQQHQKYNVPIKHGLVTLFETTDGKIYLIGIAKQNPVSRVVELQASIGGDDNAELNTALKNSVEHELARETGHGLSLSEFELSKRYVVHRSADYGKWSVCFIKLAATYQTPLSLDELKAKIAAINLATHKEYGLYELNNIIAAAKQTTGMSDELPKPSSELHNYLTSTNQSVVIFDDNAIATLFSS